MAIQRAQRTKPIDVQWLSNRPAQVRPRRQPTSLIPQRISPPLYPAGRHQDLVNLCPRRSPLADQRHKIRLAVPGAGFHRGNHPLRNASAERWPQRWPFRSARLYPQPGRNGAALPGRGFPLSFLRELPADNPPRPPRLRGQRQQGLDHLLRVDAEWIASDHGFNWRFGKSSNPIFNSARPRSLNFYLASDVGNRGLSECRPLRVPNISDKQTR